MTRVLIVDDESQLLRALQINLRARGYEITTAADGATALASAARHPPDVVLLDLGLPDLDGIEVIHGLRGWTRVPIIVLSGRTDAVDKVQALDAGADDYVTKPFNMDELLARLRTALRHHSPDTPQQPIPLGNHTIDLAAHLITRSPGEAVVHLTPTEWRILAILVRHSNQLVESRRLLIQIWGPLYRNETDNLRFHMARLRRKLEPDPTHPRHLLTEPGLGYRYQP